jgi:signal transduction histidine kinase
MTKFSLIFAAIIIANTALSQPQVDSLLHLCENASEKQKSGFYLEISFYSRNDSSKSNSYARKAYQLAVENNQIPFQAKAFYYLGETHYYSTNYQDAIPNYERAIPLFTEVRDTFNVTNCYNSIGLCYYFMYQGEKAIAQFIEGLKSCENDKKFTAQLISNIAMSHALMSNNKLAIDNYRKALSINTSIHDSASMAVNYNGLGSLFTDIKKPDSAIVNLTKALHLFTKIGRTDRQAIALANLAAIYPVYPDSLKKAMDYFDQAWKIFNKCGWNHYKAEIRLGIGDVLFKQTKYKAAIQAYNESLQLNDQFNRGILLKKANYERLSEAYERIGDYKTALEYHILYTKYSDSLNQEEKYEKIVNLEKQYETKKKENEILKLNAKQELTEIQLRKNKQLKQLGYVTAFLLLLFVFFMLKKYYEKIKSNHLLEEKNRQIEQSEQELRLLNASKNKFFSIIAHDLKNPFHTVMGYSQLLSNDYDHFSEAERRKFAVDINQSTNNIFRLLQNLLEWSKAQTGRLKFMPIEIEFRRILENSVSVLGALAEQKKIQLIFNYNDNLKVFVDPTMVETVLRNLINNAIKFTPENGLVKIRAEQIENQIRIDVCDNGIGISEEDVQNLFQIDSKVKRKGTNNEDGSGLGLILCKEFVDKNNGTLWVESTPGTGSTFSFTIPTTSSHLTSDF